MKEIIARATHFTSYKNHHSLVNSTSDLSLLVKILVEKKVFEFEVGNNIKNTKFVNFFACELSKIGLESLLKEYQRQVQGNWKTSL